MKAYWSKLWNRSIQPRRQRKYVHNAPDHIKSKFMVSTLSKELRAKHAMRNKRVIFGDTVKILRGQFKGKTGKVERIDVKKTKLYVAGIELIKKDGSKTSYPLNPSNLMIIELNLKDKKRIKSK